VPLKLLNGKTNKFITVIVIIIYIAQTNEKHSLFSDVILFVCPSVCSFVRRLGRQAAEVAAATKGVLYVFPS